jgi:hypothetical protein
VSFLYRKQAGNFYLYSAMLGWENACCIPESGMQNKNMLKEHT